MNKLLPIALCGATLSTVDLGVARADERMTIGGLVGTHIFSDTLELGAYETASADSPRNGLAFGMRAGFLVIPRLRIEGELAIIPTQTRDSEDDLTVFGWRTHALVDLMPDERLHPFALVGAGFLTAAPTNTEVLEEDSDLAAHVGLGIEYDMASNWAIRADARALFAPTTLGDYLTTNFEFFVGATKRFPVEEAPVLPDRDADGVFDDEDDCPDRVEDQDGFDDEDGCPDPDNDNDGVPDEKDQCPAEAESQNGIDDDDGCPEPDGDGDGVLGSRDLCPQEAEDIDGVEDEDGCPDAEPDPNTPDVITPSATSIEDLTPPADKPPTN